MQYERGYIAPLHPEWYEYALAGGICGNMGHNSIENCYNIGKISILEDGNEATYGIAGDTMEWTSSIKNCVSLKGAAVANMRHESIMELSEWSGR